MNVRTLICAVALASSGALVLGACKGDASNGHVNTQSAADSAASGTSAEAGAQAGSTAAPIAGTAGVSAAGASGTNTGAAGRPAAGSGSTAGSGGAAGGGTNTSGSGAAGGSGASGSASPNPTAGSGAPVGGGGGGASGTASTAPVLGPDCATDSLAGKQPFGSGFYQKFHGLFGCTAPADLALYRKMLPEKFEMPADPQVCFYAIDFETSSVGRYHEAAILLPSTYKGQSGKYVLSMDLDNYAATAGGRALGFPKYQGEVTVEQKGNDWTGTASANGTVDLKATYTGECTKSDEFLWPDFINLTPIPSGTTSSQAFLPPRNGSALRIPAEYRSAKTFRSLQGSIKLEFGDHLPWNGLVDESKPFPGLWSAFVGGVDLGNQPLD